MVTGSAPHNDDIRAFIDRAGLNLLLDHGGRAGSNFVQCLFDQHAEMLCCPLVHYVYSYWQRVFGLADTIDGASARKFIAQKSYFRYLYQDATGDIAKVIYKIGGDPSAPFDRLAFRRRVDEYFTPGKTFSRRDVILAPYAFYALGRGRDLSCIQYILINDAVSLNHENVFSGYALSLIDLARADFKNLRITALLRDPRAQFASTRHQMVNEFGNNYEIAWGEVQVALARLWRDDISLDHGPAHFCLLYQVESFRSLVRKWQGDPKADQWIFLRNEDINTNFVRTMTAYCARLGINPDPEWIAKGDDYTAYMMGRPWAGTGAYSSRYQTVRDGALANDQAAAIQKTTRPNKYVTERWKTRLPRHELRLLDSLCADEISLCRYEFLFKPKDKTPFYRVLDHLLPWSGETPGWEWIKAKPGPRFFYYLFLLPFYLLGRVKMMSYDFRDRFFTRDVTATHLPVMEVSRG